MQGKAQEWPKPSLSTLLELSLPGELLAAAYEFQCSPFCNIIFQK